MNNLPDNALDVANLTHYRSYAVPAEPKNWFKYNNDPHPMENFNVSINVTVGPGSPLHSSKHRRIGASTNRAVIETMRQIVYQYDVQNARTTDPDEVREYCQNLVPHGPNEKSVHNFNAQRITSRKPIKHIVTDTLTYADHTVNGAFKGIHGVYDALAQQGVKVTYRTMEFNLPHELSIIQTTENNSSVIDGKLVLDSDINQVAVADPVTGNVYSVAAVSESAAAASPEVSFALA